MKRIDVTPAVNNQSKVDDRNTHLIGMIGTNRTGKSTIAHELGYKWRLKRPMSEVISFDPQHKFKDITTIELDPTNDDWCELIMSYPNCLAILDDYRLLHPNNNASKQLVKLMYFRAEYNIDIIYITHTPSQVLNLLAGYTTQYYIFHTNVQQGSFEKKIPCYQECMGALQWVNRYIYSNQDYLEKNRYHLTPTGPRFPHCVVDTDTLQVRGYNFLNTNKVPKPSNILSSDEESDTDL